MFGGRQNVPLPHELRKRVPSQPKCEPLGLEFKVPLKLLRTSKGGRHTALPGTSRVAAAAVTLDLGRIPSTKDNLWTTTETNMGSDELHSSTTHFRYIQAVSIPRPTSRNSRMSR